MIIPMAAALGGNIIKGIGDYQGSRAASRQRLRQLAEMEALQQRATSQTKEFLSTYDPANSIEGANASLNIPAQQAIQGAQSAGAGFDMPAGAATAGLAQRAGDAASRTTSGRSRLASLGVAQQRTNNRLADLALRRNDILSEAEMLRGLYDNEISAAAGKGVGLRQLGGAVSAFAPALGTFSQPRQTIESY